MKWTNLARSLPAPQVPLLPASRTALMLHTIVKRMLMSEAGWGIWRDTMAQPPSITSSSTAKGDVPTQERATCHVYAEVDRSMKKLRRGNAS